MSALRNVKIVELASGVAGEYCGKLLADFGAEVIKVERPGSGSDTRRMGPFAASGPLTERSGMFAYLNTSKRSVALALEDCAAQESLLKILASADVLLDDLSGADDFEYLRLVHSVWSSRGAEAA